MTNVVTHFSKVSDVQNYAVKVSKISFKKMEKIGKDGANRFDEPVEIFEGNGLYVRYCHNKNAAHGVGVLVSFRDDRRRYCTVNLSAPMHKHNDLP